MEKLIVGLAKALGVKYFTLPEGIYPLSGKTLKKGQLGVGKEEYFLHPIIWEPGDVDWGATPLREQFREEDVPKLLEEVLRQLTEKASKTREHLSYLEKREARLREIEAALKVING